MNADSSGLNEVCLVFPGL